jgi:hypothetical protein
MGLISGLLTLPLAPVRGVVWVAEVVAEEAERVQAGEDSPEREMAELEMLVATGEISEEEAAARESELLERLIARERREGA